MELLDGFNKLLFCDDYMCFFCGAKIEEKESFLCPNCREKIEYLNREVKLDSPYLEKVVYSLFYNQFIKEKLYLYKYKNIGYYYKPLGEILISTIEEKFPIDDIDIVAFVPIHRRKKAQRGYNQSELIAKHVSEKLNIPLSKGNLVRTRWTKVQNKLDKTRRMENLKGVFKVKDKGEFIGKEILLIDDIITTGTTLNECGKVLMENEAKKVYALTITSGMKM